MQFAKIVDVDEGFLNSLWQKVENSGSFYSIGDGVTREHFDRVFYESSLVFELEDGIARFEVNPSYVEVHVLVFGHKFFRLAKQALAEIYEMASSIFRDKEIRCIIPDRMRGFKRLALAAGMTPRGFVDRMLSGIPIRCAVFSWRAK